MHHLIKRGATAILLLFIAIFALSACNDGHKEGSAQTNDSKIQQSNADRLQAKYPAHTMDVSQTRIDINKWIDRWGKDPNKLAYVYFQNANGEVTGYYVLKGLPVSYCTAVSPNYKIVTPEIPGDNNVPLVVPGVSIDGAYYSGSECNRYYGFDANTDAYIEYTAGLGINVLLYDQPLPGHANVPPLGPTTVENVKK